MNTITLKAAWAFHSIPRTIDYQAGTHEVDDEVFAAASAAGVIEQEDEGNVDGAAKAGASRRSRTAQE